MNKGMNVSKKEGLLELLIKWAFMIFKYTIRYNMMFVTPKAMKIPPIKSDADDNSSGNSSPEQILNNSWCL